MTELAPTPPVQTPLDLDACAREPIRIPGGIQPHGALVVVDPVTFEVLQVSANARAITGAEVRCGSGFADLFGTQLAADLKAWLASDDVLFLRSSELAGDALQVTAHRGDQGVLVEFEPGPQSESQTLAAVYPRLRAFVDMIAEAQTVQAIAELAVKELRTLTGFNRIMLYSFDRSGDGTVLAEAGDGELPSYLDLRFPASDIPPQARELYKLNRLRLIPDAFYQASPIQPALSPLDGRPLDLGFAALRSVSPVHLEYMRNMQTGASMSVSILVDGELWGLISCHNRAPHLLNPQLRTACDFLGQIISLQIGARERADEAARRIELKQVESELLARLSQARTFQDGLIESQDAWLKMVDADGAAVFSPDRLITVGLTPSDHELEGIAGWLSRRGTEDVFAADSLATHWPQAEAFAGAASGLLAISISQLHPSYIMWFRQEVVRTVTWGGDPRKDPGAERLHPRKSFEAWKQQVRGRSLPWSEAEIATAREFRTAVINFVLRRAEERAALSDELQRSNAELEAFSYSISHDLRAPFRHIAGFAELLRDRERNLDPKSSHYLESIVEAALQAGRLVDDLLNFSHLGRTSLRRTRVDMRKLVIEVRRGLEPEVQGREIEWRIGDLPPAWGDQVLLRQVWANLIDNAVKYTQARKPAVISIQGEQDGDELRYSVSDNGVGFEMAYVSKLFGVFQRLHSAEEFPGTGIGLALTKRIVERHGGTVGAEAEVGKGATIRFALPSRDDKETPIG